MRLVCAAGLFLALLHLSNSLLLGAFNIKALGDKKVSNTTVMNIISTVCTFIFPLFPKNVESKFSSHNLISEFHIVLRNPTCVSYLHCQVIIYD